MERDFEVVKLKDFLGLMQGNTAARFIYFDFFAIKEIGVLTADEVFELFKDDPCEYEVLSVDVENNRLTVTIATIE